MAEPQTTDRKREPEFVGLEQAFHIASEAKTAEEWFKKGDALDDIEKREEAIACLNKCLALKPDHAQAHYVKGFALSALGKKDEAMEAYNNALKHEPKLVIGYLNRGKAYVGLQKEKEALADFVKVQELAKSGLKTDGTLTEANITFIQNTLGSIVELQKASQEGEALVKENGQTNPLVLKLTAKAKLLEQDKKKNINKAFELLNRQSDAESAANNADLDKTRNELKKAITETQNELKALANTKQEAQKKVEEAQKKVEELKDVNKLKDMAGFGKKAEDGQSGEKKTEDIKTNLNNKLEENKKELNKNADELKKKMEGNKQELDKNAEEMKKKMEGLTDIKTVKATSNKGCCNMF